MISHTRIADAHEIDDASREDVQQQKQQQQQPINGLLTDSIREAIRTNAMGDDTQLGDLGKARDDGGRHSSARHWQASVYTNTAASVGSGLEQSGGDIGGKPLRVPAPTLAPAVLPLHRKLLFSVGGLPYQLTGNAYAAAALELLYSQYNHVAVVAHLQYSTIE